MHAYSRAATVLLTMLLCCFGLAVFGPPQIARADDGGYPYAQYNGPGTSPGEFIWTDSRGQWYSDRYRMAYRNCTDYVAWKLEASNGWYAGVSLGNAKDWKSWAAARSYAVDNTPAPGSVAWWGSATWNGGFGHVAYVLSTSADKNWVTLGEYNYRLDGTYSTRTIPKSSVDRFIHFADKSSGSPADNTVLDVIKKNLPGGVNAVYWAKKSQVFETWWRPGGDGIHHSSLVHIAQGDIVDIDVHIHPSGLHQLYTATRHTVWETWWYPNQGLHTAVIASSANTIRKIEKALAPDGTHQLYAMTERGIDEYWWRPGGDGVHKSRLYTLAYPVAMKKISEPNGKQVLYVADRAYAYEVAWWPGALGVNERQLIHVAQADISDIDLSVDTNGKHRLYVSQASAGVWEAAFWPEGGSVQHRRITGDAGVVAIQKYMDGSVHVLYVATAGGVFEYWWPSDASTARGGAIVGGLGGVREFHRATSADGAQAVYTAFGTNIAESYWFPGGDGIHTSIIE